VSQLLPRTSVFGAVAAAIILVIVSLVALKYKSRWESKRQVYEQRASAEISQSQLVIQNLMNEVAESRKQMIDHMNRDRREKDRVARTLGSFVAEMRAQSKALEAIRSEISRHCDSCRDRSEHLKEIILKAESRRRDSSD